MIITEDMNPWHIAGLTAPEVCLCGFEPVIEEKTVVIHESIVLYKYSCHKCKEKELPWLRQWNSWGALQEWNRIALKRSYRKRTLEYNEHGVCISEPYKVFEWVDKKRSPNHIQIEFYLDNSMYYFCYDYWYMKGGASRKVSISGRCFPSIEIAKKAALKELTRHCKDLRKILEGVLRPAQGELFV